MSAFMKWFEAQHGPRQKTEQTDEDLRKLIAAGSSAGAELLRRERWDDLANSALYAWQIKDEEKR